MKTDQLVAFLKAKTAITAIGGLLLAAVIATTGYFLVQRFGPEEKPGPEITLSASLEEIIRVSELTTFSAVYNGVTEVHNQKVPENIDYYVSYQGRVRAGIDFEQVSVRTDPENQVVTVVMPPVSVLDTTVDINSLDFMFYNKKANASAVSAQAYQACCDDIQKAGSQQKEILTLAAENGENVIRGLTQPFLEQFYPGYQLAFERGAAR